MKYFLLLICLAVALSSFLPTIPATDKLGSSSAENVKDFVIGYLVGLKVSESVPNALPCLSNLQKLKNASETAIELIKTVQFTNIIVAIEMVISELNRTKYVCNHAQAESRESFQAFLDEVKDPEFIHNALERLFDNWRIVGDDIEKGLEEWGNGSYFQAGSDFGSILRLALNGPESEYVNFIIEEIETLREYGSSVWPFKNCGDGNAALEPTSVVMDTAPAKGAAAGINIQGNVNDDVSVNRVQITTTLYGWKINTRYDNWAQSLEEGDSLAYRFAVPIPSYAPSGPYSVSLTFQDANEASVGCVSVDFHL